MQNELKVVSNATCTFCGCVCDDIELTVEGNHITKAKNACVLGKAWFLNHQAGRARLPAFGVKKLRLKKRLRKRPAF